MKPEIEALLGGYSAGTLSEDEEAQLVQAALADQDVFDALAAEQPFRELLSDSAVRQELLDALARPALWERLTAWLTMRRASLVAALATAAVVGVLLLRRAPEAPTPSPSDSGVPDLSPISRAGDPRVRAATRNRLLALPLRRSFEAEVRLDRVGEPPVYKLGDGLRLTVSVERECNLLLLEQRSDGTIVQLFPSPSSPFPRAKAGVMYSVPPAGDQALPVSAPEGPRVVRLLAFPVDVDPESVSPAQLGLIASRLTIIEKVYVVER